MKMTPEIVPDARPILLSRELVIVAALCGLIATTATSHSQLGMSVLVLQVVLLMIAIALRINFAIPLLGVASAASEIFLPSVQTWPFILLLPLVAVSVAALPSASLRHTLFPAGNLTGNLLPIILVALASIAGLLAWLHFLGPDLSAQRSLLPSWGPWLTVAAIFAFALVNAGMEELIYRGIIQGALSTIWKRPTWIIGAQAAGFAAVHFQGGVPSGWSGLVLAFIYGGLMGWLRYRSNGLLAPYAAHILTNIFIAALLFAG